ncbi:hypothetical protein GCM10009118_31150 [Wandonia haliotis]|uniref:HipA-like kinase domain-containing protein n=1 Tax=Wandonia haliotis TaxID=574963 RepID=A0ABP3Y7G8_9FLAO
MSLLPTIRITEFLDDIVSGGTTRPMLVIGENGKKYVLKIFSKRDASQRSYTVAEVLANILAKEFDLNVPEGVYMTIDKSLLKSIEQTQPEIYKKLEEKETDRILFASLYYEGYPTYSPVNKDKYLDLDEFESILAFDMLIANDDRRKDKPNILRGPEHYLLIDHEKAFEGLSVHLENIKRAILPHYFTKHLFYNKLKTESLKAQNIVNFETFEEYFRILKLDRVELNVDFLIANGYDEDECKSWLNYLFYQKENYRTFVALLKKRIRE